MNNLLFFQKLVEEEICKLSFPQQPADLYDPVRYMLSIGGKRIRPAVVLMGCELFGGKFQDALSAALGIEVFHNFTLLHDDIMDRAPIRRSRPTVHQKWNNDIAILSGDAMFVKACQLMTAVPEKQSARIMNHFLESALLVCEGQQWDMTFQAKETVSIGDYLNMISLKTAALLACALKTGAMVAGAPEEESDKLHRFGMNLGISFQLLDDILDVYGEEEKFGKKSGGDIIANKKTYLLLKAKELSTVAQQEELNHWMGINDFNHTEKVNAVRSIFSSLDVRQHAQQKMDEYYRNAITALESIEVESDRKQPLLMLAETLMLRKH
jgi:geranylgeranyl diphosphate synthase type II